MDIKNFQTPIWCCDFMAGLVPSNEINVLEPTPGAGNLVSALNSKGKQVIAPDDFYLFLNSRVGWDPRIDLIDCVVMNPPFTPMKMGYEILYECLDLSDHVIALMPWLTMINSQRRTEHLMGWGVKTIYHLPRNTFPGSRVQTCILDMVKGFEEDTLFKAPSFK